VETGVKTDKEEKKDESGDKTAESKEVIVTIDADGIIARIIKLPLPQVLTGTST